MKKILVPTDFSGTAQHALQAAKLIAQKLSAELYVINIMDMPSYLYSGITGVGEPESLKEFIAEIRKEALDNLTNQIADLNYKDAKPILEAGIPTSAIVKCAEENDIDLIVMGTTGSSGISEMLIGSTTEKIVRTAPCPVLSLSQKGGEFDLQSIVFASDFSDEKYECLDKLQALANAFDAKIHLVKIHTPQYFEHTDITHAKILKFARDNDLMNYTINQFNHSRIEEGIFQFLKSVNGSMVALATHKRKGISHLFMGSRAEDIVNRSRLPIFTFKVVK